MTLEEFVSLDPNKIRRDKELMQLFVDFYKAAFSLTPNCEGCVFKRGFDKLKRHAKGKSVNFEKNITMEQNTFILKSQYRLKILTYKEESIVYRSYGYNLTEHFAKKLVEHGKSDLFAKLPESKKSVKTVFFQKESDVNTYYEVSSENKFDYDSMDWKEEILPLYAEIRERTGEKANSRSKNDVIAFIKGHENK